MQNIGRSNQRRIGLALAALGLSCIGTQAATATGASAGAAEETDSAALAARVTLALHDDPVFYDGHVTVTAAQGTVTLHGFVFSDWDLRSAVRIASKAAAGHRVIDDLTIKLGGNK